MQNLEKRVSQLEGARALVNLTTMTDDELMAYAGTFEMGSEEMYAAVLTLVSRRPSAFPVNYGNPDRAVTNAKE